MVNIFKSKYGLNQLNPYISLYAMQTFIEQWKICVYLNQISFFIMLIWFQLKKKLFSVWKQSPLFALVLLRFEFQFSNSWLPRFGEDISRRVFLRYPHFAINECIKHKCRNFSRFRNTFLKQKRKKKTQKNVKDEKSNFEYINLFSSNQQAINWENLEFSILTL
jgi:hypothetical protein